MPEAIDDIQFWKRSGNIAVIDKISRLLNSIQQTPFEGIGKPEQLKYDLSGKWSRRITEEHRLVYRVDDNILTIYQLRFHY